VTLLSLAAALGCFEGPGAQSGAGPERIVLLTIDTLRADHVGCYGAETAQTPTLDGIAARGVRFHHAISPAPLTLPSHATLLTGLNPPQHGVRDNSIFRLAEDIPTLAEGLRAAGYATAAFVGALVLDSRHGLDRGFETYGDHMGVGAMGEGSAQFPSRSADAVVDEALGWLETAPRRFLLWVHVFDPHANYDPPAPFRAAFPNSPYDGEVAFADSELGRLLRAVEARWPDGGTLVVATSDHGESLGEHHALTHGLAVYDTTQRVPLLMAGPGIPSGLVVENVVRLADLTPTLLAMAGLPELPRTSGADLRPLLRGEDSGPRVAYLETLATRFLFDWSPLFGVRTERYKYIHAPRPELYDLERDPGERSNIAGAKPDRVRALERLLSRELADARALEPIAAPTDLDRQRLEALGYGVRDLRAELGEEVRPGGADPKDKVAVARAYFRAQQLSREDRDVEALAVLDGAGEEPGILFATLRAKLLLALGRAEEAERVARRAIAQGSRGDTAHMALGRALMLQGRFDEASEAMERAVSLNPTRATPLLGLAELHRERGDFDRAEELYRRALTTPDGSVRARLLLAALLLEGQRFDEADGLLAEVPAGVQPSVPEVLRLAQAEVVAGREQRALVRLREAAGRKPDSVPLAFAHSELAYRLRDTEGQLAAAEHALRLEPDSPVGQNNLAWVLLESDGDLNRALALSQSACAALPHDANFLDTLASLHLRRGELGKSLAASQRGLEVAEGGERARLLYLRSAALEARGEEEAAAEALGDAFALMTDPVPPPWAKDAAMLAGALRVPLPPALGTALATPPLKLEAVRPGDTW